MKGFRWSVNVDHLGFALRREDIDLLIFRRLCDAAPAEAFADMVRAAPTEVLNDTADLYRHFDATGAAEFLYACVRRTVEQDLPREIDYLGRHDEALRRIMGAVEMPDCLAENLVLFIRQNNGALSKKRREGEFNTLRDDEVTLIESIVNEAFAGF
jgi:hypothetical protein